MKVPFYPHSRLLVKKLLLREDYSLYVILMMDFSEYITLLYFQYIGGGESKSRIQLLDLVSIGHRLYFLRCYSRYLVIGKQYSSVTIHQSTHIQPSDSTGKVSIITPVTDYWLCILPLILKTCFIFSLY